MRTLHLPPLCRFERQHPHEPRYRGFGGRISMTGAMRVMAASAAPGARCCGWQTAYETPSDAKVSGGSAEAPLPSEQCAGNNYCTIKALQIEEEQGDVRAR